MDAREVGKTARVDECEFPETPSNETSCGFALVKNQKVRVPPTYTLTRPSQSFPLFSPFLSRLQALLIPTGAGI